MTTFSKPVKDMTEEELMNSIDLAWEFAHIPLAELTRRSLNDLQKTIQLFNTESSKQTKKMIKLTMGIIVLTIVMVIGLFVQIYLAWK